MLATSTLAAPNSVKKHLGSAYEIESLPASFNRADTSGDRAVSKDEAVAYIGKAVAEIESAEDHDIAGEVDKLFSDCDSDRDGKLTQDEVKDLSTLVGTKHGNLYEFYARYRTHINKQHQKKAAKLGTMSAEAKAKAAGSEKYEL